MPSAQKLPAAAGPNQASQPSQPPRPRAGVSGVSMSADRTGAEQRRRLLTAGLTVRDLPVLGDADDAEDSAEVAAG